MATIDDFLADLGPRLNNGCKLVVLCGAGLSIPAVPSAAKIVERLRSEHPNLRASSYAEAMRKAFPGRSGRMKRRAFLDHLMVEAQPLAAHHHLADLMVSGVVDDTLTTNFDQLLETALFLRSPHRVVVYVDGEALATAEHLPGGHAIIKLHGDIVFEHTANTRPEMDARLDVNFRTQLLKLLRGAALLVIGYGGGDRNVMRFLEDAAADPDCLGGGLWWWEYKSTKRPRASIRRVLDIARRQGKRAERFGSGPAELLLDRLCKAYGAFQHPEAPFGVLKSNLPFYERLPRHAIQHLQDIPLDSALKEAADLDAMVQELENNLRRHNLVFYVDKDPLRRKQVLAQWLYWLLGTSVPKTGRENSFCHTTTTYNSRQAYASILNSRQLYVGRDRKISYFSFPTSCSKDGFCGKIMSSEAAKLRVKSHCILASGGHGCRRGDST